MPPHDGAPGAACYKKTAQLNSGTESLALVSHGFHGAFVIVTMF